METKTAKILSVQENQKSYDYQGTTYYVHLIKFEGSEHTWKFDSKNTTCEKFKVGETATFDCDIKVNGQYTNYKIKPKQDPFKKGEPKDQGIITYLSCLSSAANYFTNTKPSTWEDVMSAANKAYNEAMNKSTLKS